MALKSFKPYTASRRFITMLDKSDVTKQTPDKALTESKKRTGGRNAHGEITSWHRGGGHARRYRRIDFRRDIIPAIDHSDEIVYSKQRVLGDYLATHCFNFLIHGFEPIRILMKRFATFSSACSPRGRARHRPYRVWRAPGRLERALVRDLEPGAPIKIEVPRKVRRQHRGNAWIDRARPPERARQVLLCQRS